MHLLNALQNLIKSKTFIGIFPILEQIKSCIKADEIYQDILLKNNFIEIVFSLLEFLDSLNVYSRESVSILENISWLTINITAGDSKEESTLCIKHGLIQYYARIFANVQNLMTLELLENVNLRKKL